MARFDLLDEYACIAVPVRRAAPVDRPDPALDSIARPQATGAGWPAALSYGLAALSELLRRHIGKVRTTATATRDRMAVPSKALPS
jgi:hypothetical protein